jgi:RNA polymerase sigma factor (sigma-70 family)
MVNGQLDVVVRHLHRLAGSRDGEELSDGHLLERFAVRHEEEAFAALVRRHGPMVLGVCRRLLRHGPDAEDAFQATFLILFRRARSLDRAGSLANYLYTVAYHVALKAKADAARRQRCEKEVRDMPRAQAHAEELWSDLQPVLDEELNRLPDRYRAAVVVCYLQGKTNEEAARLLGCPPGTVKSRLARARALLRTRLARRGVVLSTGPLAAILAEHAAAAVPPALVRAAVQTTVQAAAGHALAPATSLAESVLKALFVTKLKIATAVLLALGTLLLAAGVWKHQARAEGAAEEPAPAEPAAPLLPSPMGGKVRGEQAKPEPKEPAKPEDKTMTVSGRVLDPAGKPLAGAQVAVCGRQGLLLNSWQGWASLRNEVLGRTKSDKDGSYRLTVPRTDPLMTKRFVRVVATAPGRGLAWKALDPDAERAEAEVRLAPVQRVNGHVVGLQGEDAAGVTIHVARITRKPEKGEHEDDEVLRPPGGLAVSATTDAKGNFVFAGFGPGVKLELEIRDPRYERKDEWVIDTGDKKQCENIRLVLGAGRCVEGRVVYEDTGKPVPHARLMFANPIVEAEADEQGRFKVSLFGPRDYGTGLVLDIGVHAYPPTGEPYVNTFQGIDFPRGVVRRKVEVKLPRGVLVRGKVTEAGSGKPVAGAYVTHGGLRETYAVSGPDGSYQLGVPAGAGRLLVTHPSGEYVSQIVGSGGGSLAKPIGDPSYHHAVVEVDVKKAEKMKEVNVTLRRGVTVKGRLVGPDDKPVASALMFVSEHRPRYENTMHPVHVRDGKFEVRGCDPEKTYQFLFLEYPRLPRMLMMAEGLQTFGQLWLQELVNGKDRRGAAVKVVAKKAAGEPLVVRVAPCGSAKVRFTDADGKPRAGFIPWLQLVVTPGPPLWKAIEDKTLAAEVVSLVGPYGDQPPGQPKTDAKGYVIYHGLIPGATYRLKKHGAGLRNDVLEDFTVEAGKTAELEIVVK